MKDLILKANRKKFTLWEGLALAAILLLLFLWCAGCTTTQFVSNDANGGPPTTNIVSTLDTNLVVESIDFVVPPLVNYGCSKDKNVAPYLTQLSIVLRAAADSGNVDFASITNSLSKISIKEIRTPGAALVEQAVLGFYKSFASRVVDAKLDQVAWLRPVLNALADAIDAGLPAVGWNSSPMWYEREGPYRQVMAWNRSYPPNRF